MESIQEFMRILNRMELSDYLDIILVAFLIYKILPHLRTPSTARIVRTVIALVLLTGATSFLKLHTLNWILNQILTIGLLAFVILFQPELRRLLDHLANVKLSNLLGFGKPVQEEKQMIEQVVKACEKLSKEQVGALIVFARDRRLDEYYKSGTMLEAVVSEQLLRNLFVDKSPLHDGAVIIQGGRIAAAGCILPLSENPSISNLGTRHHAALGISEISDAITVAVSEETGTISVTENGMMKRYLAPQTLEKLLTMALVPEVKEDGASKTVEQLMKKLSGKEDRNEKK